MGCSVYYEIMTALSGLSQQVTNNQEVQAQTGDYVSSMLQTIYTDASTTLNTDQKNIKTNDGGASQTKFNEDAQYYQNQETLYNGIANTSQSAVSNQSSAQKQLSSMASTMNQDNSYMANLVSGPLA